MVDLAQYPNPVRLFTQTRNSWFKEFVESQGVPIHVFTNIRDTQLGQLFFNIELMRYKKMKAGEDAGKPLFEGDNIEAFVPLFQNFKLLLALFEREEVGIDLQGMKKDLLEREEIKAFQAVEKTDDEWFASLEPSRLDELYIPAAHVIMNVIFPLLDEKLSGDGDIFEKLTAADPMASETLKSLCDPVILEGVENDKYSLDEKDTTIRVYKNGDEEIKIAYGDYHGRVNVLHSLVMELIRYISEGKKYSKEFNAISDLLAMEMLVMIPSPDKAKIPLIKNYITNLKEFDANIPKSFWEIMFLSYQGFSHVSNPNSKLFQKIFKNLEKSLREESRIFWTKTTPILLGDSKKDREYAEKLVSVLWSHFRVVQAQAHNLHAQQHQGHDHDDQPNYMQRAMLRFEHVFWQPSKDYVVTDQFKSKYQYWAAYAKIANKEIRSPKDSAALFNDFEELFNTAKVLTNKTKQKQLDATLRDVKSMYQTLMSYGIEGRDGSINKKLDKYLDKFSAVIDQIEEDKDNYPEIDIEEEKKSIPAIRQYLKLELPKSADSRSINSQAPVHRLKN